MSEYYSIFHNLRINFGSNEKCILNLFDEIDMFLS